MNASVILTPCFADHFLFRTVGAYGMLTAMFTSTLFGEFGNDLKFVVFRMFPFIVGIHYLFKFLRRGLEGTRLAAASRWHRRIVTNILSFISGTSLPDPNLVLPREHEIYWKSQLNWSVPRRAVSFCDIIKATLWGAGPVRRAHHLRRNSFFRTHSRLLAHSFTHRARPPFLSLLGDRWPLRDYR